MIAMLVARFGKYFLAIGAFIAFVFMLMKHGADKEKAKQEVKELKVYKETRKKIDEAVNNSPSDADAARQRMLERQRSRRKAGGDM